MADVSLFRLYLLRATYLFMIAGLAIEIWPRIIDHDLDWPLMNSVVSSMLGTVCILAVIGLRYPLQMLPLMLFEMIWKAIWLIAVALPLWRADKIDEATSETIFACAMGIIFPIVIPWGYLFANYVKKPGDRWR